MPRRSSARRKPTSRYPVITDFTDEDGKDCMKETVQANYRRIKEEVKQIVADELERIAGDEKSETSVAAEIVYPFIYGKPVADDRLRIFIFRLEMLVDGGNDKHEQIVFQFCIIFSSMLYSSAKILNSRILSFDISSPKGICRFSFQYSIVIEDANHLNSAFISLRSFLKRVCSVTGGSLYGIISTGS